MVKLTPRAIGVWLKEFIRLLGVEVTVPSA